MSRGLAPSGAPPCISTWSFSLGSRTSTSRPGHFRGGRRLTATTCLTKAREGAGQGREAERLGPPGRCCRGGGRGPGFLPGFAPPEAMMALGKLFISFALLAQRKFKYQLLAIQSFTRDTLNAYSVPGWVL